MDGIDADPFTIVDYGCSEGANSIAAVREVLVAVRRRQPDSCVVTVHNDLPSNDFNGLFHNLVERDDSYLRVPGGPILPMASARSFYDPVVPAGTANVGVSFSAAHWYRDNPRAAVPNSICAVDGSGPPQTALAAQADEDWTRFLAMRAADLAPGGVLFVQMIGTAVDGDGRHQVTAARLLRAMHDTAAGLVDAGHLRREALERFVFPTYMRTVEEAAAPLERAGSPAAGRFRADRIAVSPIANPYLPIRHDHGDEAYATAYVAFVRAFTESTLRRALFEPGATDESVDAMTDGFYADLQRRTAVDPHWSVFEDWTLTVALTRTAEPA